MLMITSSLLFLFSLFNILLVFILYPFWILIISFIKGKNRSNYLCSDLSVSLVIVAHNAEELITNKLKNSLSLTYPSEAYEIVIFSDGSNDRTKEKVLAFTNRKIRFFESNEHEGKYNSMNKAVLKCKGDIIVFSDVDAILKSDTILNLVKHFADPTIGGVCGKKVISENIEGVNGAQKGYTKFDQKIKMLESDIGSISSNDGKVYAIRKKLFLPIPAAVTDDLYVCMSVRKQNYRFVFAPNAKAYIKTPSRSPKHEITRRRRIVSTSLRGIFKMREILNPLRFGMFSIGIIINKVLRRLLPVSLATLFICSIFLSYYSPLIKIVLYLQISFYLFASLYIFPISDIMRFAWVSKPVSIAYYFCIGNFGTLLGLVDFVMNRRIVKWKPIKTD